MKSIQILFFFQFIFLITFAQKKAPDNWFNLDPKKDKVYGVSTERAYSELLRDRKGKTVVVAVIDGGTDATHVDLKDNIWINPKEIPGNGIDDDGNGYVDDIHGWNFIGGKNGSNVNEDNLEVTRVYARLKPKYEKADTSAMNAKEKGEYNKYIYARKEYFKGKQEGAMYANLYGNLVKGMESIRNNIGTQPVTLKNVKEYKPSSNVELIAQSVTLQSFEKKLSAKDSIPFSELISGIVDAQKHFEKEIKFNYNTELDTRQIVGDNYDDPTDKNYGNSDVKGPTADHGTHVAGIIGALRNNNTGMNGVAADIRIMIVRVVPDGDERDKDVANGIRYAVDNEASIINMSFGKAFSYNKKVVDDAVRYAAARDVLMVHAAGNDSKNNDEVNNFPTPFFENAVNGEPDKSARVPGWIEVGASSWMKKKALAAPFSNYGKNTVDVFAPGVDIYSTIPDSKYTSFDGTSMASPVTTGVAALLRSYYPDLTAVQVRDIILRSAVPIRKKVLLPGEKDKKVKMTELCATGGIVNAYEALKLAESYKK